MSKQSNLLVDLSRYADRQGENFTTEAFVHLLKHLVSQQPSVAGRLLTGMTGHWFNLETDDIHISTQDITEDGTPDIRIAAPGYLGYIEVKLGAILGAGQLSSYRNALRKAGMDQTSLTLLTRYPYPIPEGEEPDLAIRWFQIAQWLERELSSGELDSVSKYLIEQFLGYLEALNITIHQVRSGISKGLREYMEKNGEPLTNGTRYRSPQKLLDFPELLPLYQLMLIMGEALAGARDENGLPFKLKFDMGKHEGGWIGYNLNSMDYFVQISVSNPEKLVFQAYRRPFDPRLWDEKVGRYRHDCKPMRWENELDLAAPEIGFFKLEKLRQFELIQSFVQFSLKEAEKCFPTNLSNHEPA